jgi:tRNA (guanine-N7-)-methyltransferase
MREPGKEPPRDGLQRLWGRSQAFRLRPRQQALMASLLPRIRIELAARAGEAFFAPAQPERLSLEIGFGGGEHLVSEASAHPRTGFIGVEPFVNGMAKALAAIAAEHLSNVRLHHGDATDVLAWLPSRSLARVDLIYPDPWPKRRHWKRRFIQDHSIAAIARVLHPGGEFRFATDVPDYAAWTLKHLLRSPHFAWTAERADDWRRAWPGFPGTRYEAKAKRAGRVPCYLVFRRTEGA